MGRGVGGEGQRERGTENPTWALCWQQWARHGLELMSHEIMTWAEVRHSTNWATQVLQEIFLIISNILFIYLNQCFDKLPFHHLGDSTSTWVKCTLPIYILLKGGTYLIYSFTLTKSVSMCLLTFWVYYKMKIGKKKKRLFWFLAITFVAQLKVWHKAIYNWTCGFPKDLL